MTPLNEIKLESLDEVVGGLEEAPYVPRRCREAQANVNRAWWGVVGHSWNHAVERNQWSLQAVERAGANLRQARADRDVACNLNPDASR